MKEEDYLMIEAYLQGELSAEEGTALAARAATDAAFASALAERRQLHLHLKAEAGEDALRATLRPLGERYFPASAGEAASVRQLPAKRRRWWLGVAAAAAIVLAMIAGGQFLGGESNVYERFAQHEPLSLTERGEAGGNTASQAEDAFNNGRYREAVDLLERYLREQAEDERARLSLGVSLLEDDQDEAAVEVFEEIVASGSTLAAYGNWYLALAAVKRGDNAEAERYLLRIPASDAYLRERADRLRAAL